MSLFIVEERCKPARLRIFRRLLPSPALVPVHAKDESLGFKLAFALDELEYLWNKKL